MSTYDTRSSADQSAGAGDIKERAVDTVAEVDAGAMYVAGVAGEEVGNVAHDVKDAARGFLGETRVQLLDQASTQQRRAADALRGTGDELQGMASGTSGGAEGVATSAVRALGLQSRRAADWLEQREPADVVREVRGFARRHTGAFLVIALGVGIVAGRLTRALMADAHNTRALPSGTDAASGADRPALVGSTGAAGAAAAGWSGSAAGADGVGAGTSDESTPIADALGDPLSAGAGTAAPAHGQNLSSTEEAARDEWSPSGEARR